MASRPQELWDILAVRMPYNPQPPEVAYAVCDLEDAPTAAVIRRIEDLSALARAAGFPEAER